MRVLVAWADDASPNLGVRALGAGSAALVRRALPDAEIVSMNFGRRPTAVPWGSPRSLLRERLTGAVGMQRWLGGFDLYWDTRSGDSFADIYGLRRHATMSLVHEFAVQAGTPAALAPQTIGPFSTRRGRLLARRSLARSELVFARDPRSAEAAAALGRPVDAIASDLVFGLDAPPRSSEHDVLLNVSGLLWSANGHVDAAGYRDAVRRVVDGLLERGREVSLLPHVLDSPNADNDVPASRELADELRGRVRLLEPVDLEHARSLIAGARLVVGARMHACLNALSVGTPAIAMAYSRKFAPLLRSVGWDQVVGLGDARAAERVLEHVDDPGLEAAAAAAKERGRRMLDPVVARLGAL